MASIEQAVSVAKAAGCDHLVLTTGGRSEKYAMAQYPKLPEVAFIEMVDFVGFALKSCKKQNIVKVSLVGMMGKFSKVAQGVMMVHSNSASINFEFMAQLAKDIGANAETIREVAEANTASQVGKVMSVKGYTAFFDHLCKACCYSSLHHVKGGMVMAKLIYSMHGHFTSKG